jgi:MFS transporter, SP family, galactose:H+ symporter
LAAQKNAGSNNRFVYIAAAISALGGLLFGYDTGVISGAILFVKKDFGLSSTVEEIVVSAVLVGALIGAAAGGALADRIGRRKTIIIAAVIFAFGALGTALSPNVEILVVGRIIVGLAIGIASFTAPLYLSEIAPEQIRGRLVAFNQLALTFGIVISYLVDYAFSGSADWRVMFGLAAIPAVVLGLGMIRMPDSPGWLIMQKRNQDAHKTLSRISPQSNPDKDIQEISHSLQQQKSGWRELLRPMVKPALIVGVGLALFQQITGINTVIYYAPTIFQFAGISSASNAILATAAVGVVNIILTAVAMTLLDKVGRRPLLLIGLAGMVVSILVLGVAFSMPQTSSTGAIAVVALMAYVGFFAVGLGPVFWLLISEIYPLKIRGKAMSIATEANWGANLIVALTFLSMVAVIGHSGTFWFYGAVGVAAWIFSYMLVPETRGRTLESIEDHWRKGKHPREM